MIRDSKESRIGDGFTLECRDWTGTNPETRQWDGVSCGVPGIDLWIASPVLFLHPTIVNQL